MDTYGQLVKAQLEQLSSDPGGTPATGLVWFNTVGVVAKFYDGVAIRTVADTASSQIYTNKTLTSPAINTPTISSPVITTAATFNAQAELRLADSDSSNYVGFKSPATVTANVIWTMPDVDGSANQVLQTDGSKTLSWASIASSTLNQYNTDIGNSSNVRTATNTSLLGDSEAITGSFTFATTDVNTGTEVITKTAHGLASGDRVYLTSSGGLPAGLTASTTYYVIKLTADTFQLATSFANAFKTIAGASTTDVSPINLTTTGSGTHSLFYGGIVKNSPQYLEATLTTLTTFSASATYFDVCSVNVGKGTWMFRGCYEITINTATFTTSEFIIGITGTTGNSSTGIVVSDNAKDFESVVPLTFSRFAHEISDIRVVNDGSNLIIAGTSTALNADGTGTVYLKASVAGFSGSPKYRGSLMCTKLSI